jgi:hypothetical protein
MRQKAATIAAFLFSAYDFFQLPAQRIQGVTAVLNPHVRSIGEIPQTNDLRHLLTHRRVMLTSNPPGQHTLRPKICVTEPLNRHITGFTHAISASDTVVKNDLIEAEGFLKGLDHY